MAHLLKNRNEVQIALLGEWITLSQTHSANTVRIGFSKEEWLQIKEIIDKELQPHIFAPYKDKND